MVTWRIEYTKNAVKHKDLLKSANLDKKAKKIIDAIKEDPYIIPPPFEKLRADLVGKYSRRINIQHRIVYSIDSEKRLITVYGMFSHYDI